jgi:hypothetical protein
VSGFGSDKQPALLILLATAGIGSAVAIPRLGLKGLFIGGIGGPIAFIAIVFGGVGAAWLVQAAKRRLSRSEEGVSGPDDSTEEIV